MLAAAVVFSLIIACVFGMVFAAAWHFKRRRPSELRRWLTFAQAALLAAALVCGAAGAALAGRPDGRTLAQALLLSAAFAVPLLATGATRGQEPMGVALMYLFGVALGLPIAFLQRAGCRHAPTCVAAVTLALVYLGIAVAASTALGEDPRPLRVELPIAVLVPAPIVIGVALLQGDGTSSAFMHATADALVRGALYVLLHFGGVLAAFAELMRWRPWAATGATACSLMNSSGSRRSPPHFDESTDMTPCVRRLRDDRPSLRVVVSLQIPEDEPGMPAATGRVAELHRAMKRVLTPFEEPTGLRIELTDDDGGDIEVAMSRLPGQLMWVAPSPDRDGVTRITIDSDHAGDLDYGTGPSRPGRLNFQRMVQHGIALALGAPPSLEPEDVTYMNFDKSSAPIGLSASVAGALRALYEKKTVRLPYKVDGGATRRATFHFSDTSDLRAQKAEFARERPNMKWVET